MRVAQAILVLALTVGMNPGLVEVFQDGMHLVVDGHTDHAEGTDPCSEHGCAPTGHHCDCCTSMQMVRPAPMATVPETRMTERRYPARAEDDAPRGVRRRVARPPSA